MKNKRVIIIGTVLAVCAIVLVGLYISGASGTVRFDNQLKLGNKYLLEGNYEEAILAFEKAIQIEPKSVDARLGLAEAYVAVDRADDAIAVLEEAMGIDPKRPEPYINLARIYIVRNELDKAIEILEAGIINSGDASIAALLDEIKPNAPKASVKSGKYAEAITVSFKGIAENDEVYYTLDNTPPSNESIKYNNPISLTNGSYVLRAVTYRNNGITGEESRYEYQIDIPAYAVQFQDAAFERAIRKMLGKETGEILNTDLIGIWRIWIYGEEVMGKDYDYGASLSEGRFMIDGIWYDKFGQIRSLDDLKHFPDIQSIRIAYQEKLDISALSGLTNLMELNLSDNQISDISVLRGLTNLTSLSLSNNQISDISVLEGLTNLTYLSIDNNQISDINVLEDLTNLKSLSLSDNPISDISVLRGLINLTDLDLSLRDNQTGDISILKGLKNLVRLSLGGERISDISILNDLTNLTYFNLSNSQISDISALKGLKNLTYLFLSNNQISDISALKGLTNLELLFLWGNPLSNNQITELRKVLPNCEIVF